jgi:hypothetical protein
VAARDPALFVAQHDVPVEGACRREERQRVAVDPFDLRAAAIALTDRRLVQPFCDGDRRLVEDGARRRGEGDVALPPGGGDPFGRVDKSQVGLRRRGGMVGLVGAEERPVRD